MRMRSVVAASFLALASQGCATILGGSSQTVTFNSNVNGADVYLNQTLLGKTPLTASIKRGQEGTFRVQMAGYQPYQIAVNKKISTLFWVNIFTGGVTGSTTDAVTGAMYEYEPSTFMVSLQRADFSSAERGQWIRKEGLRSFVLLNNEALIADLAAGRGEYLDVLLDVFHVTPAGRQSAITGWRSAYSNAKTSAEFAGRLVEALDR